MRTADEKKLLARVGRDELVNLTRDLVRIDSVIRPDTGNTEREVVRFITGWIRRELGLEPLVEEVMPGRENIIVTLDSGHPGPCLMLEGHTDVVSEGERSRWTRDPFGAEVADGRIYGRGSCDMKAGVAVALLTAAAFKRSGIPWKGKLRLGLVCDEEGMMLGIKHYIRPGHADDVTACLVPGARREPALPEHEGRHARHRTGAGQDGARRHAPVGHQPQYAPCADHHRLRSFRGNGEEALRSRQVPRAAISHLHRSSRAASRQPLAAQRDTGRGRGVRGYPHRARAGPCHGARAAPGHPRRARETGPRLQGGHPVHRGPSRCRHHEGRTHRAGDSRGVPRDHGPGAACTTVCPARPTAPSSAPGRRSPAS